MGTWALTTFALICSVCGGEDIHVVDFAQDSSLAAVFRAGLHPKQVSGLENRICEVTAVNVAFVLPSGIRLDIPAQRAEFFVYDNDLLGSATAYTDYLSVDQAYAEAARIQQILGEPLERLRDYIELVRANPLGVTSDYAVRTKPNTTTPRVSIFFLPGSDAQRPLRLALKLEWSRPPAERRHRTTNISPPPEYASESMTPAQRAAPSPTIASASPSQAAVPTVSSSPTPPEAGSVTPESEESANNARSTVWLWVLAALVASVAVIAWFWRAKRK